MNPASPVCRRLLVAQGPQQLLAGLACLRQRSGRDGRAHEDVLVLGDFMAPEAASNIDATCRSIARQHPFHAVHSTHALDKRAYKNEIRLHEYIAGVIRCLGCREFDEVITARNSQLLNEVVLHAFTGARKITIGDGLGHIDNNCPNVASPILPTGYVSPDELQAILPLEAKPGSFDGLPVERIDPDRYVDAVRRAARELDVRKVINRTDPESENAPTAILLMANLTESGHVKRLEDELAFTLDSALPFLKSGSRVWVKGHPRHCFNQPAMVAGQLRDLGFQAFHDPDVDTIPSECLAVDLPVTVLISTLSHTCISWRLLKPETPLVIGMPRAAAEKHLTRPQLWHAVTVQRYLQTVMTTLRRFDPVSLAVIHEIHNRLPAWVHEMPAASSPLAHEVHELVEEVIQSSRAKFCSTTTGQTADAHKQDGASKFHKAILDALAAGRCAGERAKLLEEIEPAAPRPDEGSAKLRDHVDKLSRRVDRLNGELQEIHGTIVWRCLRWLFKFERSIGRRGRSWRERRR